MMQLALLPPTPIHLSPMPYSANNDKHLNQYNHTFHNADTLKPPDFNISGEDGSQSPPTLMQRRRVKHISQSVGKIGDGGKGTSHGRKLEDRSQDEINAKSGSQNFRIMGNIPFVRSIFRQKGKDTVSKMKVIKNQRVSSYSSRSSNTSSWMKNNNTNQRNPNFFKNKTVSIAIILWYILGVISISTTKVLLRDWSISPYIKMTPLNLTFQQFLIGAIFLRFIIYIRHTTSAISRKNKNYNGSSSSAKTREITLTTFNLFQFYNFRHADERLQTASFHLMLSSTFFCLGFYFTNIGFAKGQASFVETIKASEPITSASAAALWGLERAGFNEILSLLSICIGVVISTFGNVTGNPNRSEKATTMPPIQVQHTRNIQKHDLNDLGNLTSTGLIVFASNLCFSFRGLYQKFYRASPHGKNTVVNDLHLQFRMQLFGVWATGIYLLVTNIIPSNLLQKYMRFGRTLNDDYLSNEVQHSLTSSNSVGALTTYIFLALINGFAFTSYNLASTFVLSKISVVHHAAFNCTRRLFAIIVTSVVFGVPITNLSMLGIVISFSGFLSFSHFKRLRSSQPRSIPYLLPLSEG